MAFKDDILRSDRFTEKERRNLAILDIIRRKREVSRAEISKITHLNIVTISNYVDDYISKTLVLEKGLDVSTGGRRPELLELNAKYGYAMGIDLGAPHITEDSCVCGVILDVSGKIVARAKRKKEREPQDRLIEKVKDLAQELLSVSKIQAAKIKGIGIGIWGVLDRHKGTVRYAVETGEVFSYTTLQSVLEREFEVPTLVEHDATAGALGEKWVGLGLASEAENILYICSDSSCGMILNGEIYYGASKSAGELNLNPPIPDSKEETCWSKYDHGCGFRSRGIDLGIQSRAMAYFEKNRSSDSRILALAKNDPSNITLGMVIEASKSNDKVARELLVEAGNYLGLKISFLVNLFNPDAVVIGRGIERCGEIFISAVRVSIKKWAYEESLKIAKVVPTSLGEDSIACGASALVMQQVFARI
ncbi:MAG: ROK family protein [Candidatus Omnitrophota bacterium]